MGAQKSNSYLDGLPGSLTEHDNFRPWADVVYSRVFHPNPEDAGMIKIPRCPEEYAEAGG